MTAPASTAFASHWADVAPAVDDAGRARWLELPALDSSLAAWGRNCAALATGLLGRHRLLPEQAGRYMAALTMTPALRERWAQLFDLRQGPGGVHYPFLYAHGAARVLHGRVFADLGLNTRHVQHLRHHTRLPAGTLALNACDDQQLECHLRRAVRTGPTEVLLVIDTTLRDADGRAIAQVEDCYVARHLEVAYAVQAQEDDALRRAVARLRRRTPEIDVLDNAVRQRQLYVAPDAGRRFGRVSGDTGLAHGGYLGARVAGYRRPAVQAMYLRNLVARELAEWGLDLGQLQVTFASRAALGQTLRLLQLGERFELLDARGRLVAFGRV